jgi:hypothetical protein
MNENSMTDIAHEILNANVRSQVALIIAMFLYAVILGLRRN